MKLTVIIQDRISEWEKKGEIVEGYFNPSNRFKAVDVVLLNDDNPSAGLLNRLCGNVSNRVFNLPLITPKIMLVTFGWRMFILKYKLNSLLNWLALSPPDIIRAYETNLAAYCAKAAAEECGCEYVVSLHSTPDQAALRSFSTFKDRLVRKLTSQAGNSGMYGAHKIMAVYWSILQALPKELAQKTDIVPNAVGIMRSDIKSDYRSKGPLKLVTTGRLVRGKSPKVILDALARSENTHLTVIGDGPLRNSLMEHAHNLKIQGRIKFIRRMDNKSLCAALSEFDAFVFRTDYQECPKTVIEAALIGLPIVCPKNLQLKIKELQELSLISCEDSSEGFSKVFSHIQDEDVRRSIGQQIGMEAEKLWSPQFCANKAADILVSLIKENNL